MRSLSTVPVLSLLCLLSLCSGEVLERQGRQQAAAGADPPKKINGGVDFSKATVDPATGRRCVIKNEEVQSIEKDPILECTHKNVEKCHYTYVTEFSAAQEEVCEENFEKTCQIVFKKQAQNESIKKCYRPLVKTCNGEGPKECRTVYESACMTRYIEKQPGKFVGDTHCEKLPIEICGAGCITKEGPEECHDKSITSLIDVPEETCDLNPQKTCRLQTKLVPNLKPTHECTVVPQEVCHLKFSTPKAIKKPLMSKWCLDDTPSPPGETYADSNALAPPISTAGAAGRTGRTGDSSATVKAVPASAVAKNEEKGEDLEEEEVDEEEEEEEEAVEEERKPEVEHNREVTEEDAKAAAQAATKAARKAAETAAAAASAAPPPPPPTESTTLKAKEAKTEEKEKLKGAASFLAPAFKVALVAKGREGARKREAKVPFETQQFANFKDVSVILPSEVIA